MPVFEAHNINAQAHKDSYQSYSLVYINDRPRNILRFLVNIYAGDTNGYVHTSKIQDDRRLAADLHADLALITQ